MRFSMFACRRWLQNGLSHQTTHVRQLIVAVAVVVVIVVVVVVVAILHSIAVCGDLATIALQYKGTGRLTLV